MATLLPVPRVPPDSRTVFFTTLCPSPLIRVVARQVRLMPLERPGPFLRSPTMTHRIQCAHLIMVIMLTASQSITTSMTKAPQELLPRLWRRAGRMPSHRVGAMAPARRPQTPAGSGR